MRKYFKIYLLAFLIGGSIYLMFTPFESKNKSDKTTVEIEKKTVNLGCVKHNLASRASFKLNNIGKKPLEIQSIKTSCGCTVAKYDKKPIAQGETTTVVLEYKPNTLGYFTKTADVVCNVPEGSIRLRIYGEVFKE